MDRVGSISNLMKSVKVYIESEAFGKSYSGAILYVVQVILRPLRCWERALGVVPRNSDRGTPNEFRCARPLFFVASAALINEYLASTVREEYDNGHGRGHVAHWALSTQRRSSSIIASAARG